MILNLIKFKAFNCLCMDEILNNKDEFFYCLSCKTNSNLKDIFENHRLYCANFTNLNDIMEYTFCYDINDLLKLLEIIKVKYGDVPLYSLNKQFDLFTEINRVYVEDVEGEEVLILSDEAPKEVKEDHKDYKN